MNRFHAQRAQIGGQIPSRSVFTLRCPQDDGAQFQWYALGLDDMEDEQA